MSISLLRKSIRKYKKAGIISAFGGSFLVVFLIGCVVVYFYFFTNLPSPYELKDFGSIPLSSQIFDRNGKLLFEIFKDEKRTPVSIEKIPDSLINATISIEDKTFYSHQGVSLVSGVLRALKENITSKSGLQGGSTITQQLVKGALLTPERTIKRKVREMVLALWTEQIFSKDEILELYLNQVPYGGLAYGIEQASQTYFEKDVSQLSLAESALLAGLPQAPTLYSPHTNPERAKTRRNTVLQEMYEEGYISESEFNKAINEPVIVAPPKIELKAPHFVFEVKKLLEEQYGLNQLEEGGLRVTTTLDLDIQEQAETTVAQEIESLDRYNVSNGAALVTRPPTGEILAMVGSADYFAQPSGAFNVTTANTRQPGSSIKPINYAVGIDRGIVTASSMFLDIPTCFNAPGQPSAYCPKNYDGSFHGPVQLRYALANSYNIPAVKMLAYNGVDTFIASTEAFLITSFNENRENDRYGLSLTLGGGELAMTEMAQAFSAFANRGKPRNLHYVLKVEDKFGNILYEFKDPNYIQNVNEPIELPNYLSMKGKQAISQGTAFIISHILQDNGARSQAFGTNSELVISGKSVSVKTGTTNDLRDNWTVGYTPNFLVATWVGNNDFTPMNQGIASGLTGASPIWNSIMTNVLEEQPDLSPVKPESVEGVQVCNDTGVRALAQGEGYNCPTRFEYLIKDTNSSANIEKALVPVNRDTDQYLPDPGNPAIEMREKTVLYDMFNQYCLECNHEDEPKQIVTIYE